MIRFLHKFKTLYNILKFHIKESHYNGVGYMYYPKKSNTLLICFSALPPTNIRVYNNIKGFCNLGVARLYIKDKWGFRGSYYYYENGDNYPYYKSCLLIEKIIREGGYTRIITAGTSKGGSCAILFGLRFNASDIFSGACQYYIGDFLAVPCHKEILDKMRGNRNREAFINELNSIMPMYIAEKRESKTCVHLVYSKKESTYDDHLRYLIKDLKRNNIKCMEYECDFIDHNDVGYHFVSFVNNWFTNDILE